MVIDESPEENPQMLRIHHSCLARAAALLLLLLLLQPGCAAAQGVDVSLWRQGDPALEDSFSRNTGQWNIDGASDALSAIGRGRLSVQVPEEELFRWVTLDSDEAFKDFYVEIDATHIDGPTDGMMGIMFRSADADNFYAFLADAEGYFAVLAYVDGELDRLIDWTEAGALNTGEGAENRLAVLASGREIVVLANDEELERVQDRSFAGGEIALIAGTNTHGELEVAFDNFGLWNKPASTPGRKSITRSTPTATARPAADAVVTSSTLNVRSGPGTNYAIVGALKKGDGVDIVGRSKDGKWARLSLPKINEAWASAQYLEMAIDFAGIAVAVAPAPPPQPKQPANNNLAWLVIENHIGRYITVQVNDKNFRVEGKVGDKPGRYQFTLQGVGRYRIAAQLPNGGSHNWDLYVEPTADKCANRQGCVALGQTFLQTYY
jgi:hypothetical protein